MSKKIETIDQVTEEINEKLSNKTKEFEEKAMLLEESRHWLIKQDAQIVGFKNNIKSLELDLKKEKKSLLDFRNLAPPELRNQANPFRTLVKQLADLQGTLKYIENSKPDTFDFEMQ